MPDVVYLIDLDDSTSDTKLLVKAKALSSMTTSTLKDLEIILLGL